MKPGGALLTAALAATVPLLVGAAPDSAQYKADPDGLFWFLTVADSHIGSSLWGGKQDTQNLEWATSALVETVQPAFLVIAGDLTDGTGGGLIPLGQFEEEWDAYQSILDANAMTPDFCYDLPGNHDQYEDGGLTHYLGHSVQGRAGNGPNLAWTLDRGGSKYLFVGLASCGADGAFWPMDASGLDAIDQAFFNAAVAEHADADILTVFMHHPASYLEEGQDFLYEALAQNGASALLFGHTHDCSLEWQEETLHSNVASLGKSGNSQVALTAYDYRGMSAKAFSVGEWPQVLVTAPLDADLAGNHIYDYMVPDWMTEAPVRAIAFHPDGISGVTALLDGSLEIPMSLVEENVWQGFLDASALDEYPHKLLVTATGGGQSDQHEVTFYVFDDPNPPEPEPPVEQNEEDVTPQVDGTALELVEILEQEEGDLAAPAADSLDGPTGETPETPGPEALAPLDNTSSPEAASADQFSGDIGTTADGRNPDGAGDPWAGKAVGKISGGGDGGCSTSRGPASTASLLFLVLFAALVFLRSLAASGYLGAVPHADGFGPMTNVSSAPRPSSSCVTQARSSFWPSSEADWT